MSDAAPFHRTEPPLIAALELLERAISYARSSLQLVSPAAMHAPTPCRDWDLAALLRHMDDSLRALQDAGETGRVAMIPRDPDDPTSPVDSLKDRACALLGAWAANGGADLVAVAGCPVAAHLLVTTGAVEITIHGWDVAQACGRAMPIPPALAAALLPIVRVVVTDADRGRRFAAAVAVSPWVSPGDKLVAALGRQPWRITACP